MIITIDLNQVRNEKNNLSDFLKSKIQVIITINGDSLILDTGDEEPSIKSIKELLRKFLRQRCLEEKYGIIEEKKTYKIIERKDTKNAKLKDNEKRDSKRGGKPPSVYHTLPYLFP